MTIYRILGGVFALGLLMRARSRNTGGGPIRRGVGFRLLTGALVVGVGLWLAGKAPVGNYNSPVFLLAGVCVIGGIAWFILRAMFDSGEVVESYKDDARYDASERAWNNRDQSARGGINIGEVRYQTGQAEQRQQSVYDQMPSNMAHRVWNIVDDCKCGTVDQRQAMEEIREVVGRNAYDHMRGEFEELVR
jgi:hypothetical protein